MDLGTFQAVVLVSHDQTAGELTVLQTQLETSGFGPPLHRHHDAAEAFFVLEGDYLMFTGNEQHLCPPGSFVDVSRGVPHTFNVASEGPGNKLNLVTPAALVGFFEELAATEQAGTSTRSLLDQIAARNQREVLGPVPDSCL